MEDLRRIEQLEYQVKQLQQQLADLTKQFGEHVTKHNVGINLPAELQKLGS